MHRDPSSSREVDAWPLWSCGPRVRLIWLSDEAARRLGPRLLRRFEQTHYAGRLVVPACALLGARLGGRWIGVLAVAHPTLNGRWRRGWLDAEGDRAAGARSLNRRLRRIARVMVEPRYRALGVGSRMVRAYLRESVTPCTEALAGMVGPRGSLFESAGMRRIATLSDPRDRTLRSALRACRVRPIDLIRPGLRWWRNPRARHAVLAWANASRSTRSLVGPARQSSAARRVLAARAARALTAPPTAFVHTRHHIGEGADGITPKS